MIQLLRENRYFFVPYAIILFASLALLLMFTKPELHILSNKANSPAMDFFFKYFTHIGDGAFIALLGIVLLFYKFRLAIIFVAGSLAGTGVVNLIKRLLTDVYRPAKYFELFETYPLHFVEGVKLHSYRSFPSGHTATAFALFTMLALMVKNKYLKSLFLLLAVLVSYSRVYLSQHFMVDIVAGSVAGTVAIVLAWLWINRIRRTWPDKSLISR